MMDLPPGYAPKVEAKAEADATWEGVADRIKSGSGEPPWEE